MIFGLLSECLFYACDFSHLVIIFVKTCIARALGSGQWPALDGADADPSYLVRVFLELWLVDLHEINSSSSGDKYNTHNSYCYALACMCEID